MERLDFDENLLFEKARIIAGQFDLTPIDVAIALKLKQACQAIDKINEDLEQTKLGELALSIGCIIEEVKWLRKKLKG